MNKKKLYLTLHFQKEIERMIKKQLKQEISKEDNGKKYIIAFKNNNTIAVRESKYWKHQKKNMYNPKV